MATNYLEQLIAEWYEYKGYFVRRNVLVGKRAKGGYKCELDIVAFHPETKHLVHIEPSMDASRWAEREKRYQKKFGGGRLMLIDELLQAIFQELRDKHLASSAIPEHLTVLRSS